MLNPPSKPGADIVGSYRAADEAARKAAREATEGFHKAQQAGDMAAAQHWADSLKATMEALKEFRASLSPRDQFIAKYQIEAINDHTVSFTLPAGSSRYKFLREAQAISRSAFGQDAVNSIRLKAAKSDPASSISVQESTTIAIDGSVEATQGKTRTEQIAILNSKGLFLPNIEDLLAAHAAFYVLTGSDLFKSYMARSSTGTLIFGSHGNGFYSHDAEEAGSERLVAAGQIREGVLQPRQL